MITQRVVKAQYNPLGSYCQVDGYLYQRSQFDVETSNAELGLNYEADTSKLI
ncbi:hypothetical protein SynWH8101_1435 [Synechococcus sp. WH 8101]|nr:hypothetical protein SynWH8101_1435 [Synechococcus sp. WH 8101]QNI45251.1 hypothetical protein SynRCC2555_01468 [Synechococcus sp. WH 8101]